MTDLSNPWPSWGEQGELPSNGFFYEGGDQVNEKTLDSLWNTQQESYDTLINGITNRVEDLQGDIRLDNGLVVTQTGTLKTTISASASGAYVNGQKTGPSDETVLTHSSNSGTTPRTDSIWVDVNGQVNKTENTATVADNRFKIAEVTVDTSSTITTVTNVGPKKLRLFASRDEPETTGSGDVWFDTDADRLKTKESGAFHTLVTDEDAITITAGTGLSGGGNVSVYNGNTNLSLTNDSVTITAGDNLTGGGEVSLGETTTLNVTGSNLDADSVDGYEGDYLLSHVEVRTSAPTNPDSGQVWIID